MTGSGSFGHVEVRRGDYHDSVSLMAATAVVRAVPGVGAALVAMGTELNRGLVAGMGFWGEAGGEAAGAGPTDLIVAVAGSGSEVVGAALAALDGHFAAARSAAGRSADGSGASSGSGSASGSASPPPRTTAAALRRSGGSLVLISTPGPYATVEACDALVHDASPIIFSDNVPLSDERALKEVAHDRGLLVMGPDCGTVVIDSVGYGFANVVPPGPVGLVAASGTGAQQVMSLLASAGVGVTHCLGTGGRDLSDEIGGISTLDALTSLDADARTTLIVVVAKPPSPTVATRVRSHAATLSTPVHFALIGDPTTTRTTTLTSAVEEVLRALDHPVPSSWPSWHPPAQPCSPEPRQITGLFSGGTLCAEAQSLITAAGLAPHADLTDFGADEYTRGRPHPMLDNLIRLEALSRLHDRDGTEPSTVPPVVLLDVVLGRGAHPDPAAELAPALAPLTAAGSPVIVSLCGAPDDPQGLAGQAARLTAAGAHVYLSNAAAVHAAIEMSGLA